MKVQNLSTNAKENRTRACEKEANATRTGSRRADQTALGVQRAHFDVLSVGRAASFLGRAFLLCHYAAGQLSPGFEPQPNLVGTATAALVLSAHPPSPTSLKLTPCFVLFCRNGEISFHPKNNKNS